jgi:hypothetical protein
VKIIDRRINLLCRELLARCMFERLQYQAL